MKSARSNPSSEPPRAEGGPPEAPSEEATGQLGAARWGSPGVWCGSFLALLSALLVFSYSGTEIQRFPDRAIGVGLLNGVDVSRRYTIYLLLVVLPFGVWLGCGQLGQVLRARFPSWLVGAPVPSGERSLRHAVRRGQCCPGGQVAANRLDGLEL